MSRYVALWLVLLALAFVNAAFREVLYKDELGEDLAARVSLLPLLTLIVLTTWFANRKWPIQSRSQAWGIGVIWAGLTALFELLLVLLMDRPWSRVAEQYDLSQGSCWPLFLVGMVLTPPVVLWLARSPNVKNESRQQR